MAFILGMGNPLLDISSPCEESFITKYDVPMGAARLATDKDQTMYGEMSKMPSVEYIPGGGTLNAIRIAQWTLGKAGRTGYMGAIGSDDYGKRMTEQLGQDGVQPCLMINEAVPTGTCAICIKDKERGMVANLAAANTYQLEHFQKNLALATKARIVYSAGFFLTVCPDAMMLAAKETEKTGALYCLNLAAPFIAQVFKDPLKAALGMSDIVFGNETEAEAYAGTQGMEDKSVPAVAKYIANLPRDKKGKHRTCVLTQGAEKTIVACSDGFYMEVPVQKLEKDKIVDLNAAGDAFVGGFLASLSEGKDIKSCVEMGHKTARYIIQRSGCQLEGASANRLFEE